MHSMHLCAGLAEPDVCPEWPGVQLVFWHLQLLWNSSELFCGHCVMVKAGHDGTTLHPGPAPLLGQLTD